MAGTDGGVCEAGALSGREGQTRRRGPPTKSHKANSTPQPIAAAFCFVDAVAALEPWLPEECCTSHEARVRIHQIVAWASSPWLGRPANRGMGGLHGD